MKDLIDRVNTTGGEGMPGIIKYFELFNKAGMLSRSEPFREEFAKLLDRCSAEYGPMPADNAQLREWMERALSEFLGFAVPAPFPLPRFTQDQWIFMERYSLRPFFFPSINPERYPSHLKRWMNLNNVSLLNRLPGKWIVCEVRAGTIDDPIMAQCGIPQYFGEIDLSDEKEILDPVGYVQKKVEELLSPFGGRVCFPSDEVHVFSLCLGAWLQDHKKCYGCSPRLRSISQKTCPQRFTAPIPGIRFIIEP